MENAEYSKKPFGLMLLPSEAESALERKAELSNVKYCNRFGIQNMTCAKTASEPCSNKVYLNKSLVREFADGIEEVAGFSEEYYSNGGLFIEPTLGVLKHSCLLAIPKRKEIITFEYFVEIRKHWSVLVGDYIDIFGGVPPSSDGVLTFSKVFGYEPNIRSIERVLSEKNKRKILA